MSVVCVLHNMCVNHCMLDAINMLQFICVFFFKCHCHLICTSVTPDCAPYCVSLLKIVSISVYSFLFFTHMLSEVKNIFGTGENDFLQIYFNWIVSI